MNLIRPRSERKRDKAGNVVTRHWDGRQDVAIKAKPVNVRTAVERPGS